MSQLDEFRYLETNSYQMLQMPYNSLSFSMVIVLPQTNHALPEIEKMLSLNLIEQFRSIDYVSEVAIELPKFIATCEIDLGKPLATMGMTDAFSGKADFSGITPDKSLFIQAALHKAAVVVNEEGTEAAAASLVAMGQGIPERFTADHPFLFWIQDDTSGAILFIGRVADPSKD